MNCILEHGKQFSVFKDAISVGIVLGESGIDCAYDLVFSEMGHLDSALWMVIFILLCQLPVLCMKIG
jgi:hypothetical protein